MNFQEALDWFDAHPSKRKSFGNKFVSESLVDRAGRHYVGIGNTERGCTSVERVQGKSLCLVDAMSMEFFVPSYPDPQSDLLRWTSEGEGLERTDNGRRFFTLESEVDVLACLALIAEYRSRTEDR